MTKFIFIFVLVLFLATVLVANALTPIEDDTNPPDEADLYEIVNTMMGTSFISSEELGDYEIVDDGWWREWNGNITITATYAEQDQELWWENFTNSGFILIRSADGYDYTPVVFSTTEVDFYFKDITGGNTWYSLDGLNADGETHMVTYDMSTDQNLTFICAFEDQSGLGDQDYNDLVFMITMAVPTSTLPIVTPSAGTGGSIYPSTPQTVNYLDTTFFTVQPDPCYRIDSVTGCGGTLVGNTYTTGPITDNCDVTATFALDPVNITTLSPLDEGRVGIPFSQTLNATGGLLPYSWSYTGDLPDGLDLNSSTGEISGTPTTEGTPDFNVTVTDDNSCTDTKNFLITIQSSNARIWRKPPLSPIYHSTIQAAYDDPDLSDGDIIQCQALVLNENILCDFNVAVTLEGGYNTDFTSIIGHTTINGQMTISNGTVVVENIVIQ